MGIAYKQFLASDLKVLPFTVNKGFSLPQSQFATGSDSQLTGVDRFLGQNSSSFETNKTTTGTLSTQYQVLVYSSTQELYYSNFLSQSYGDVVQIASLVPGVNSEGDVLVGSTDSTGRYFNYLQSTLTASRYFPTGSNEFVGVISIPSKLFGDNIQPYSFNYTFISGSTHIITDDGEGNLLSGGINVGNIIYPHGLAIITNQSLASGSVETTNVTCSFSSSYTLYETQYKCTIRENEFNYTLNPSTVSSSYSISGSFYNFAYPTGSVYNYVTSSYFSPFITTIGLYNENQELLAIGKLAQPLQTSNTTDTTILINLDR
jgi:hypothetical protein